VASHTPRIVISLHDVSPLTEGRCRRIVQELEQMGVQKLSLLVIPDHHAKGRTVDAPALCEWLRQCAQNGHEIVTHGYFHRREKKPGENLMQRMTTRVYTAGEGEFFDAGRAEAAALVRRGNDELRSVGLAPRGFIAPAWLLGAEAENGLRDAGCEYTTRLREVLDLRSGAVAASQSLCWSVRASWRRVVSLVWNASLFARLERAPLMRIAVHPVDVGHEAIWKQIRTLVRAALERRTPTTYLEWIMQQRAALPSAS
jgi:predicted deacetylase